MEAIVNRGEQKGVWVSGASAVELRPVYDSTGVIRLVDIHRIARATVEPWFERFWRKARVLDENWITDDVFSSSSLHKEHGHGHTPHRR